MINLGCEEFLVDLFESEEFVAIVAITLGCLTGMVAIVSATVAGVVKTRARETTRREMAAYVAEGTIKPDEAVAMLNAGLPKWERPGPDAVIGKRS